MTSYPPQATKILKIPIAFYRVAAAYPAASGHAAKHTQARHDTIPRRLVDSAVGVALLSSLSDLQYRFAHLNPIAQSQLREVETFDQKIFRKVSRFQQRDLLFDFLGFFGVEQTDLAMLKTEMSVSFQTLVFYQKGFANVRFLHTFGRRSTHGNDMSSHSQKISLL
jgi:hypothetical protein